jgi:hypothetical protein
MPQGAFYIRKVSVQGPATDSAHKKERKMKDKKEEGKETNFLSK